MDTVGVRVQNLPTRSQVLTIARIAQGRSDTGRFSIPALTTLFENIGLPQPGNVHATVAALVKEKLLVRQGTGRAATYRLSPVGLARSVELASDMDLAALMAESGTGLPLLGATGHPVIPPSLAPPDLVGPLHEFFERHPFETNVFGMTRFPDDDEDKGPPDPVAPALDVAREVCEEHGLTFHLASDRQIVDDLWPNVAAHMWACRYGIAFFEDRRGRGINYNLSIEVGSTIVLGRRVAILKDRTIDQGQNVERLPTDLTGRIYKPVDLDDADTVRGALTSWIKDDLAL